MIHSWDCKGRSFHDLTRKINPNITTGNPKKKRTSIMMLWNESTTLDEAKYTGSSIIPWLKMYVWMVSGPFPKRRTQGSSEKIRKDSCQSENRASIDSIFSCGRSKNRHDPIAKSNMKNTNLCWVFVYPQRIFQRRYQTVSTIHIILPVKRITREKRTKRNVWLRRENIEEAMGKSMTRYPAR